MKFCVYVLQCADGSYYTGSTRALRSRLGAHRVGRVKYTRSKLPVLLVFVKFFPSYDQALAFEKRVKSWKKRKSIECMFDKEDNVSDQFMNF